MGSTLMGSNKISNHSLQTGSQQNILNDLLTQLGPDAIQAFSQYFQNGNTDDLFQKSVVDPAMLNYEQKTLPAIQQRFVDANAGSSSALNQALGQSAVDLNTMIGSQAGQFYQNQQNNQLNAINMLLGLTGQRTFEPVVKQKQGLAGPLLTAAGTLTGGYMGGPNVGTLASKMFG